MALGVVLYMPLTLPETNKAPENKQSQKENSSANFQPLIFSGELLVSGRVCNFI